MIGVEIDPIASFPTLESEALVQLVEVALSPTRTTVQHPRIKFPSPARHVARHRLAQFRTLAALGTSWGELLDTNRKGLNMRAIDGHFERVLAGPREANATHL